MVVTSSPSLSSPGSLSAATTAAGLAACTCQQVAFIEVSLATLNQGLENLHSFRRRPRCNFQRQYDMSKAVCHTLLGTHSTSLKATDLQTRQMHVPTSCAQGAAHCPGSCSGERLGWGGADR